MDPKLQQLIEFYAASATKAWAAHVVTDPYGKVVTNTAGTPLIESFATAAVKEVVDTDNEKSVVHFITTPRIDYAKDVVNPFGYDTKAHEKNGGAVFHNHRWSGPQDLPIGKNLWMKPGRNGVMAKTLYAVDERSDGFAKDVFNLVKGGFLNSYSIGFFPHEYSFVTIGDMLKLINNEFDIPNVTEFAADDKVCYHSKAKGYEYSQVCVPMNQDATVMRSLQKALADGEIMSDRGKDIFGKMAGGRQDLGDVSTGDAALEKGVIGYKKHPLADAGAAWDAGKEVKAADVSDLKEMCAYYDGDGSKKGDYKLPHHTKSGYKTVWRGVANAASRLPQSSIPASAHGGIKAHLGKHYKEFDKTPPWESQSALWEEYVGLCKQFRESDWSETFACDIREMQLKLFPELIQKDPADGDGPDDDQADEEILEAIEDMGEILQAMNQKLDTLIEICEEDDDDGNGGSGDGDKGVKHNSAPAGETSVDLEKLRKAAVEGEVSRVVGTIKQTQNHERT